jgi:peptidoglycan/LPS O-acetylase OafA/YrhL
LAPASGATSCAARSAYDGWWHTTTFSVEGRVFRDLPAAIGFAAIVLACAGAARPGPLASRPLRGLGQVSFGLYLWHLPLIVGLRALHLWPAGAAPALAVLLPVSVAFATASWRWVERPVLEAARRIEAAPRERRRRIAAAALSTRPG